MLGINIPLTGNPRESMDEVRINVLWNSEGRHNSAVECKGYTLKHSDVYWVGLGRSAFHWFVSAIPLDSREYWQRGIP